MDEDTSTARVYLVDVAEKRVTKLIVYVPKGKSFHEVSDIMDANGYYECDEIIKTNVDPVDVTKSREFKPNQVWRTVGGAHVTLTSVTENEVKAENIMGITSSYKPEGVVHYEEPTPDDLMTFLYNKTSSE